MLMQVSRLDRPGIDDDEIRGMSFGTLQEFHDDLGVVGIAVSGDTVRCQRALRSENDDST